MNSHCQWQTPLTGGVREYVGKHCLLSAPLLNLRKCTEHFQFFNTRSLKQSRKNNFILHIIAWKEQTHYLYTSPQIFT